MVESKSSRRSAKPRNTSPEDAELEELKDQQSSSAQQTDRGSGDRRMRDDELVINTSEQIEIVTSFD